MITQKVIKKKDLELIKAMTMEEINETIELYQENLQKYALERKSARQHLDYMDGILDVTYRNLIRVMIGKEEKMKEME